MSSGSKLLMHIQGQQTDYSTVWDEEVV